MILSEKYFSFHVWLGKLCKEWSKNPRITALAIRCKIEADNGELRPRVFIISPEKDPEEVPSLPTSPSPYKRWPVWFSYLEDQFRLVVSENRLRPFREISFGRWEPLEREFPSDW